MRTSLTIGKVAKEAGVNPKTIRYYEEIGLLPRAQRNGSGYRTYTGADLERLMLIRRARLLGLSLIETKELVGYAVDGHCSALESRLAKMLDERLAEIDNKIADLNRLKAEMSDYRSRLRARPGSERSQTMPQGPAACHCLDNARRKEETHDGPTEEATPVEFSQAGMRLRMRPGEEVADKVPKARKRVG